MIDQSHNVTDPIESLMQSAIEIARARAQAQLVDAEALAAAQEANDALTAHRLLKAGFLTDVSPLIAEARLQGRRRARSDRDLSRQRLPGRGGARTPRGRGRVCRHRCKERIWMISPRWRAYPPNSGATVC